MKTFSLQMTKDQLFTLAKLCRAGEYVINSTKRVGEELPEYRGLSAWVYTNVYLSMYPGVAPDDIEDNEISDISDRLFDSIKEFLTNYERDIISEYEAG